MNKTKAVETLKKEVIAEVIKEAKKETIKVVKKNEEKETKEKKSNSEVATTAIVQKSKNTKQKKIQSKETVKPKLKVIMAKIDAKVKNLAKNLELKNLVKIDAMTDDQVSLAVYNIPFYTPKNIYLDQLNMFDNRLIYSKVNLASYSDNDIIGIKERKMRILNWEKNKLLLQLESLQNG
jgi:hypothetical protein